MKKIYLFLTLFLTAWMVSCDNQDEVKGKFDPERDIEVERGVAPGEQYTVEKGVKYVDVFYYMPKGFSPQADWHWRLSGVISHFQDFFTDNLKRFHRIDKKFELIRNVNNPKYIKIHLLQGQVDLAMKDNMDEDEASSSVVEKKIAMAEELYSYWKQNPAEKTGHHHLIIMPKGEVGGIMQLLGEDNILDFFVFMPVDHERLDIKYFNYDNFRNRYLTELNTMLFGIGWVFGLDDNRRYFQQNFYTLYDKSYCKYPERVRLTDADALILAQSEAFNPRSEEAKYDVLPARNQFYIEDFVMEKNASSITLTCDFISELPVVRLFAYEDPWKETLYDDPAPDQDIKRAYTTPDAVIFYSEELEELKVENGKYFYHAVINVPTSFILDYSKQPIGNMEYSKSEFRLKFLLKNGDVFPAEDDFYLPDTEIHPYRLRWQYYWLPGIKSGTYDALLLTDLREHDEEIYNWRNFSSTGYLSMDGNIYSFWTASLKDGKKPELTINALNGGKYTVDGIRIWAPGENTPLRISVYAEADGIEKLVVENRLIPGDELMYKYINFDRMENVSKLRVRIEGCAKDDVKIAEVEIYKKKDSQ